MPLTIEIGNFILAPRPRYSVIERDYAPQLRQSTGNCNCLPMVKNWEIILDVNMIGHGDIAAARKAYTDLEAWLATICRTNIQVYKRQYCTEQALTYYLTGGYLKPTNLDWMPDCCESTSLSAEVHLITADITSGPELLVYNYSTLI